MTRILLLRNPSSLFASCIRKASSIVNPAYPTEAGPLLQRVVDLWKDYAREFLGRTHDLEPKVKIYFNEWFTNQDYRRRLSGELSYKFSEDTFSSVSSYGGGSSFDGTEYSGRNQATSVLDRTSRLNEHEKELLDRVLADSEFRDLTAEVESSL